MRGAVVIGSVALHAGFRLCAMIMSLGLVLGASTAFAQSRKALVIGNEAYENIQTAAKARADARAVAAALGALELQPVIQHFDLDRAAMARAIEVFTGSIGTNDLVVFYFVGNGVAINSRNLLLPVDAPAARAGEESSVVEAAFPLGDIIATLQRRGARVMAIIDAARDNPFDRPGIRPLEVGRGLAAMPLPPALTYTLFSAAPNEEARTRIDARDASPTSVFARALIPLLADKDLSIADLGANVQRRVAMLTQARGLRQVPTVYERGLGADYLSGRSAPQYPDTVRAKVRSDGSKRFKFAEAVGIENELPRKEECEIIGRRFNDQLRVEGGENVRFWVRISPGDIGYCQRMQGQWYVEVFDRSMQDGFVLDLKQGRR